MSYRIVVVDDDLLSLKSAKALLNEQGMQVICVRSGKELLKYLEKNTADIILLDILMPEMDGFETYSAVRDFEEKSKKVPIPIIFLTGENNNDMERRGLKEGASDFIRKPIDRDILIKRITNTIENNKKIESLTEEATIDKLTGFLNKAAGTKRIIEMCAEHEGTLLVLDLDNFKFVNDLFGHDMGDRVLVAFSNIIRRCVRSGDIVSRIGGDEFMAFMLDFFGENAMVSLSERLNGHLAEEADRLMGSDHGIPLGISIGASGTDLHGKEYSKLFQYADSALYKVKNNGKHSFLIYREEESSPEKNDLEQELLRTSQILSERGERSGALMLGKDAFTWNYRFINRFIERYDAVATKMLIALSDEDDGAPGDEDVEEFAEILKNNLGSSDIIFQNKPNQFFIVLTMVSIEDAHKVADRILNVWKMTGHSEKIKIRYAVSAVE